MAKFVWKEPSQSELTATAHAMKEGGLYESIFKQGIRKYKQRRGENNVRILPPTFGKRNYPVYPIFVHYGVGPDNATFLCARRMFSQDCAVCDHRQRLMDEGEDEAANELKINSQFIAWVIDRMDKDDAIGPQVMQYGYGVNSSIAAVSLEEEGGTLVFFHPEKGYDLTYTQNHKGGDQKNVSYIGHKFSRRESPIHRNEALMDQWLEYINDNPLDQILKDVDYDYVKKCIGTRKSSVADDADEDDPPPRTSRSLRDDLDDEIPEHGSNGHASEEEDDTPPWKGKEDEPEKPRERPKLAEVPEPQAASSGALARLRERRGARQ